MIHIPHYAEKALETRQEPDETQDQAHARLRRLQAEMTEAVDAGSWRSVRWAEPMTHAFAEAIRSCTCFVDVGAEIGFYSYLALRLMPPGGRIVCIEADPARASALRELFRDQPTVEVLNVAAHDRAGTLALTKPRGQSATTADVEGEKFSVPARTLDEVIGQREPDVIKIDIEGAEAHAFAGLQQTLGRGRARVFLELHSWVDQIYPEGTAAIEQLLRSKGYSLRSLDTAKARLVDALRGLHFLLVPPNETSLPVPSLPRREFQIEELILDYTRSCNSHCTYCSIWEIKNPDELSLDALERVFSARQLSGLKSCYVTGGEPYVSDRVLDIAKLIKRYIPTCLMTGATNAIQVERVLKRVLAIRDMGLQIQVQVSLNGDRHDHDQTRGRPGYWDRAVRFIDRLLEHRIPTAAVFSIMPQTVRSLPYMLEFCRLRGIDLEVAWVRQSSRYDSVDESYSTWPEELLPRLRQIEALPDEFDCPAMDKRLAVTPDGSVYPCEVYHSDIYLGNVNESSLEEILDRPETVQIADRIAARGCTWCQGAGEHDGVPKWMLMDCYRRQSPQAVELRKGVQQALYSDPATSERMLDQILEPVQNARPEQVAEPRIRAAIQASRARARMKLQP